ncbi:cytosine permease [Raoultella planticola]
MTKPQSVHVENLESNTIRPIPLNMRHGKPGDLFTIWFGSNIMLLTVITGAMSVTIFHLSFFWSVIALLIGSLVGGLFMALHSAQGPRLGVPQMVQTKGQFGSYVLRVGTGGIDRGINVYRIYRLQPGIRRAVNARYL